MNHLFFNKYFRPFIFYVFYSLVITSLTGWVNTSAAESSYIKLSYNMLESNSNVDTLRLVVKLSVKNISSNTLYRVAARLHDTSNINISAEDGDIYFGDIPAGKAVLSSDSFTITSDVGGLIQESPLKEAVWSVEFTDINNNTIIEEFVLK